jgi:hypothetical protein
MASSLLHGHALQWLIRPNTVSEQFRNLEDPRLGTPTSTLLSHTKWEDLPVGQLVCLCENKPVIIAWGFSFCTHRPPSLQPCSSHLFLGGLCTAAVNLNRHLV